MEFDEVVEPGTSELSWPPWAICVVEPSSIGETAKNGAICAGIGSKNESCHGLMVVRLLEKKSR